MSDTGLFFCFCCCPMDGKQARPGRLVLAFEYFWFCGSEMPQRVASSGSKTEHTSNLHNANAAKASSCVPDGLRHAKNNETPPWPVLKKRRHYKKKKMCNKQITCEYLGFCFF